MRYACPSCKKVFGLLTDWRKHIKVGCAKQSVRKSVSKLSQTIKFNQKYCTFCEMEFESMFEIGKHFNEKHKSTKMLMCQVCGRGTLSENVLKTHENTHRNSDSELTSDEKPHSKSPIVKTEPRSSETNSNGTGSDQKQSNFDSNRNSREQKEENKNEIRTNCPICLLRLTSTIDVLEHFENRHSSQLYPCPACPDIFDKRVAWKAHWLNEHQDDPNKSRFDYEQVKFPKFFYSFTDI